MISPCSEVRLHTAAQGLRRSSVLQSPGKTPGKFGRVLVSCQETRLAMGHKFGHIANRETDDRGSRQQCFGDGLRRVVFTRRKGKHVCGGIDQ